MAASDPEAILIEHEKMAQDLLGSASGAIQNAAGALANSASLGFTPFQFMYPSMSFGSPNKTIEEPKKPTTPKLRAIPIVQTIPTDIPSFTQVFAETAPHPPNIAVPTVPNPNLPAEFTPPAGQQELNLPNQPNLLPISETGLPFPSINIPGSPTINDPVFAGQAPADPTTITLAEYLAQLTTSYAQYSSMLPDLIKSNWRTWYAILLADHPQIAQLQGILNTYFVTGGAGIPVPIEIAIATRAGSRVAGEQRRARAKVYDAMDKAGLFLPSGTLLAGLKESAQLESEAASKVITDVAIKNLDLEHDHMKFMLELGVKLESTLIDASLGIAKVLTEINGQAIEITKTILNGMVEINKIIVQIYLAKWEGYKAAVEVYRAQIAANDARIRVYEAQIRAELAKTEVNKSFVDMIQALAQANTAIVAMYKTQIEGETAKLEIDRIRVLIYEAQMRGYVGQVEAYKARWEGYTAEVNGQLAQSKLFESQMLGFKGSIDAFVAQANAYESRTRGLAVRADAVSKTNAALLSSWTAEADGVLKSFGYDMESYKTQWLVEVERLKIEASYWAVGMETIRAFNSTNAQLQMEMGREHLTQWVQQLEGNLRAAQGLGSLAGVSGSLAASVLAGVTSFAGVTETILSQ